MALENLKGSLASDREEWHYWILEMEDSQLVARGKAMDVYLDDIPLPDGEESHFELTSMGNDILHSEARTSLRKAIRAREPNYRKEKREIRLLWITLVSAIGALFGAATGYITLLRK